MTAEIQRRGMVRPITDLPVAPSSAGVVEIEIGGQFYQVNVATLIPPPGIDVFNQWTAFQAPFQVNLNDLKGHAVTAAGVVVSADAPEILGGPSAKFDGTGGLQYTTSESLNLRDMDFGIEGWFRTASVQQFTTFFERDINSAGGFTLIINNDSASDGKLAFYENATSLIVKTTAGGFNDNAWHHVAFVRAGLTFYIFIDGVLQGTTGFSSLSVWPSASGALFLGNSPTAGRHLVGYMASWRLLKGVPTYTVPFTVPTTTFPTN